jgi:hypothetical protein
MTEENTEVTQAPDEGGEQPTTVDEGVSQAKVQELIDGAYAKAYNKADVKNKEQVETLTQTIEELKKQVAQGNKKPSGDIIDKSEYEHAVNSLNEEKQKLSDELAEKNASIRNGNITTALIDAVSGENVVDVSTVMQLVRPYIDYDEEGKLIVLNENGNPKHNTAGQYLSVKEYVTEFVNSKPWLLKGSQGGSGSSNAMFGADGKIKINRPADIANLSDEDFEKLKSDGLNLNLGSGVQVGYKKTRNKFIEARQKQMAKANRGR